MFILCYHVIIYLEESYKMSKNTVVNILDVFSTRRLGKVETMSSQKKSHNDIMKQRLKTLIEKIKSGQSTFNNVLVMDTSGPKCEDAIH